MLKSKATKWFALAAGCLAVSASGVASEVYRYTDENGTVHYGDRPTGEADEQQVAIVSRPTDPVAVQQRYQARYGESDDSSGSSEESAQEEERKPTRAELKAAEAQRAADCEQYRARLERFESARRLYRESEGGERYYMTDDEILETRTKARELVDKTCN